MSPTHVPTTAPTDVPTAAPTEWVVVTENIAINALNQSGSDIFQSTVNGALSAVRLQHISGGVSCTGDSPNDYLFVVCVVIWPRS